eukprot:754634-Hanusia_phi.AAC.1
MDLLLHPTTPLVHIKHPLSPSEGLSLPLLLTLPAPGTPLPSWHPPGPYPTPPHHHHNYPTICMV